MKYIFFIILFFCVNSIFSQEDRYWSTSFNTEASLLAGAVVGGNSNITSLYYNPAGISEIEEKKIMLNVNLFKLNNESYKNIIGDKESISKFTFRVQPRFVSYIYRSKKNRKLSFQLAIFTKSSEYKSISAFTDKTSDIIIPNKEVSIKNSYDYFNEYNDYWGGAGTSYQINDNLSIGVSGFISVKNQLYSVYQYSIISTETGLLSDSTKNIIADESERVSMYDVRLRGKIGVRYKIRHFYLGVNITIPSLKLFGEGDVKHRVTYTNNTDTNLFENSIIVHENTLFRVVQIKDPLSIAIGGVYHFNKNKTQIYFTVEYFNKIPTYLLVDGTRVVGNKKNEYTEGTHFTSYKYGAKSIINYAIGYKQILSDNFDLILGFRTDYSAYAVSNTGKFEGINEIQNIHNDLLHFTIGSNFNYKRSQFIVGIQYSYGKKDNTTEYDSNSYENLFKFVGINNENMIYTIKSFGLFLGYSIKF